MSQVVGRQGVPPAEPIHISHSLPPVAACRLPLEPSPAPSVAPRRHTAQASGLSLSLLVITCILSKGRLFTLQMGDNDVGYEEIQKTGIEDSTIAGTIDRIALPARPLLFTKTSPPALRLGQAPSPGHAVLPHQLLEHSHSPLPLRPYSSTRAAE